jgi:hypothetical protein
MANSKSSRRKSDELRHRFGGPGSDAAPVRYLHRTREEMLDRIFHAILLAGLVVALAFLAGSVRRLWAVHGNLQPAWLQLLALCGPVTTAAFAVRLVIAKVHEIRELSLELHRLRDQIATLREEMRRRD